MADRPLIGVNADWTEDPQPRATLRGTYVDAIARAGGLPVVLPPTRAPRDAAALVARLDGLVLSGGNDLDPRRYGQRPHPSVETLHPRREAFDLALVRAALARDLPLLAICGGMQTLNVACGGTLLQHIPAAVPGAIPHRPAPDGDGDVRHPVAIAAGSRLAAALGGTRRLRVASHHHQAVDRLGRGCAIVARAPDGVVEAIERPRARFCLAPQWHPERGGAADARLFAALVRAARAAGGRRHRG